MRKLLSLLGVYFILMQLVSLYSTEDISEWQSGQDNTINELRQLERSSNYPIHISKDISFPRIFSETPQLLLMFEQLDFQSKSDVDLAIFTGDITRYGFQLRYRLGGPAIVHRVRVRWVAINDNKITIQNHEIGFMDLKNMRSGDGLRSDQFVFSLGRPYIQQPRILIFISGFKINPDGQPYSILTDADIIDSETYFVNLQTCCSKVRYLTMHVLISEDNSFLMDSSRVNEESLSYFDLSTTREGIGRQRYSTLIPREYGIVDISHAIMVSGISGFEVDSQDEDCFGIELEQLHIRENRFSLSYGPMKEDCKVYEIDFNVILHHPALPDQINEERIQEQHRLMQNHQHPNRDNRDDDDNSVIAQQGLQQQQQQLQKKFIQ